MSRGFVRAFLIAICGAADLSALTLPYRAFALHPYLPIKNAHNLKQNKRSLKNMPPWQRKAFARTKCSR
jgi:hypothetical protein